MKIKNKIRIKSGGSRGGRKTKEALPPARRPSFWNCVSSTGGGGRNIGISPEKNALSESGGAQGGAISFDGDSVGQIQRKTLAALSQSLHSLRSLQEAVINASESVAVADAVQHLQTVLKTVEALRLETGDR